MGKRRSKVISTSRKPATWRTSWKYGALPVTLDVVDITSVSATVGGDQLRAGIIAGLIGLALVSIYLLLYYRVLGLVAVMSLAVAGGLLYLFVVISPRPSDSPSPWPASPALIVAVGITADSFIVYFERMPRRASRRTIPTAGLRQRMVRARRTLLACGLCHAARRQWCCPYFLSIGSVRGFAFILGLTTVIDLIIAFWFTHPVVVLMGRRKFMQGGSKWSGLDPERLGGHSALDTLAGQSRRKRRDDYQEFHSRRHRRRRSW